MAVSFHIRIPEDLHESLKSQATAEDRSISAVMVRMLRAQIDSREGIKRWMRDLTPVRSKNEDAESAKAVSALLCGELEDTIHRALLSGQPIAICPDEASADAVREIAPNAEIHIEPTMLHTQVGAIYRDDVAEVRYGDPDSVSDRIAVGFLESLREES